MSEQQATSDVIFTQAAAQQVRTIIESDGRDGLMLRVFVQGGGCSGFQYGFDLETDVADGDTVIETDGVKLVVDPMSMQYLLGAQVDYKQDLTGSQFLISNPNATTTCGCGSSFTV